MKRRFCQRELSAVGRISIVMEGAITVTMVLIILAYIGTAIWFICKRRTIAGSIGASIGFLGGGGVIIPVAEAVATFVCWAVVIGIGLCILGAVFEY